ncbi:MAG: oligoribonuclease [Pseudomonadota bacterium]
MSETAQHTEPARLIWIDLEMTGLEPAHDRIIEIATIVTDADLNEIAVGPVIAVHQPQERMSSMDEWNTRQHGQSGLTERVRLSSETAASAEAQTITFLEQHVSHGVSPMCGNSICQDRRFLARYMPTLEAYFHYRNLDVSTIKILANLWRTEVLDGFTKASNHLALDDIRDSIAELAHYRAQWLR